MRIVRQSIKTALFTLLATLAIILGGVASPAAASSAHPINVQEACAFQHEGIMVDAATDNWRDPYSWYCKRKTGGTSGSGLTLSIPFGLAVTNEGASEYEVLGGMDIQNWCNVRHPGSRADLEYIPGMSADAFAWKCWY